MDATIIPFKSNVLRDDRGLIVQNLDTLVESELHPLYGDVISRQATINIGTIGHVAHGKSTVVRSISGVQTIRFKNELERNITIKLGYANAKIYKCNNASCPPPLCYCSRGSAYPDIFPCAREGCDGSYTIQRHVSFVDCPGHDILMATMLNGAAVMDAALLLVAGNEPCPQPQTAEHLAAVEVMKLGNLLILQNKIDLIKKTQAHEQYQQIQKFIKGTIAENSPVIPISAQFKYNIEVICEYIVNHIPVPKRIYSAPARLIIVRSFDINKPGCEVDDLKGGVAGGSLLQGILKVGQEIEFRPGLVTKDEKGNMVSQPLKSRIVSLYTEKNDLQYAVPGGLIGVGTDVDPSLCRGDRMVGQILGAIGTLPSVYNVLHINFVLLRRYLGVKSDADKKAARINSLKEGDTLLVNIGSLSTGCRVLVVKKDLAKLHLTQPVCTEMNERLALSRKVGEYWRLIGWAKVYKGAEIKTLLPK